MESKLMGLPAAWQERIEVDAKARWPLHVNEPENEKLRAAYEVGAMIYAPWLYTCQTNYAALQAKCERYEAALKKIESLANGATILHLQTCRKVANETLSAGEGDKKDNAPAEGKKLTPEEAEHRRKAIEWYRNPEGDAEMEAKEAWKKRMGVNFDEPGAIQDYCFYEQGFQDGRAATPQGIGWVKASERLPASWHLKCVRFIHTKQPLIDPEAWLNENQKAIEVVEWLDEGGGKEIGPLAFAEWVAALYKYKDGMWEDDDGLYYSTAQLLDKFKKENIPG